MCVEAVDDFLVALKLITDWFTTNKIIKKIYTTLYTHENMFYFNEDFGNIVINWNGMGFLNIDLSNINLDNNFDEDDPDTVILIRLFAWHNKFEKRKALKKM